jgi:hypothetical protein
VQREIGYDPDPYIAAVSRRRLESYGPQIRAAQAAANAPAQPGTTRPDAGSDQPDAGSDQPDAGSDQPDAGSDQP